MKYAPLLTAIMAGSLMACSSPDQAATPAAAPAPAAAPGLPPVDAEAALRSVVPDLAQRPASSATTC